MNERERRERFWSEVERGIKAAARHGVWTLLLCPSCVTAQVVLGARDPSHAFAGVMTGILFGGAFGVALFLGLVPAAALQFRAAGDSVAEGRERRARIGPTAVRYGLNAALVLLIVGYGMHRMSQGFADFSDSIAGGPDSPPRPTPAHDFDIVALAGETWSVAKRVSLPIALGVLVEWASANPAWVREQWARRFPS